MFTGIVQTLGRVRRIEPVRGGARIEIACGLRGLAIGESIAMSGACMTVVEDAGASRWTCARSLRRTASPCARAPVNRSVRSGFRTARRHLVQGHVDAVGKKCWPSRPGGAWIYTFEAPPAWRARREKGSIAVDVSLTVAALQGRRFDVAVIAHRGHDTRRASPATWSISGGRW
jgi:riboflavin synthase